MSGAAMVLVFFLGAMPSAEREVYSLYLCPVHFDEQATGPGRCSRCGRELVLRRLVSSYSCPMHPAIDEETEGVCPVCGMKLVRTTREARWICAERPDVFFSTPGSCPGGSPMEMRTLAMAHGDHNPRHGGVLFMAPDGYHHLEGTLTDDSEFRVYLYDDFTRALPIEGFEARTTEAPMKASSDGSFLAVKVEPSRQPLDVELHLRFPGGGEEARFDFTFSRTPEAPVALPEFRIPEKAEDVYQEIVRRDERIRDLIRRGAWPDLYIPAMEAKDLVLALVEREGERVERPAKKLVRAAWLLDTHGDRGNRVEVEKAYRLFEEAIQELIELETAHAN